MGNSSEVTLGLMHEWDLIVGLQCTAPSITKTNSYFRFLKVKCVTWSDESPFTIFSKSGVH